jgi:diguanylate cyclase (GGDEF)-like protein/PAS domain S-box-containing protein
MSNRATTPHDGALPDGDVQRLCLLNLLGAREERFFFKDLESRFLLVSDGWLAAVGRGRSLAEVIGKSDFDFFSAPHASDAFEDEQRIIRTGEAMVGKIECETFPDRENSWVSTSKWPLRDDSRRIIGTFGVSRDVTAQMRDPATGLANRLALMDRLRQALVSLERQPGRVAVLFLDIDGFKQINDTHGHRIGDAVLAQLAKRLIGVSRRFDTVARYGGDEFVLLFTSLREEENLAVIAERVMRAVRVPMAFSGLTLQVSGSIGAVTTSEASADPDTLLEQGDTAMYAAKRAGGGRLEQYDPGLHPPLGGSSACSPGDCGH